MTLAATQTLWKLRNSSDEVPTCQHAWWPHTDYRNAFVLWRGLNIDYEGGVLDNPTRVAIHLTHRLGALVASVALGCAAVFVLRQRDRSNGSPPILAPGYPFTPIAFSLLIVILLVLIGIKNSRQALSGLLVLAAGLLVYELFLRRPRWMMPRRES